MRSFNSFAAAARDAGVDCMKAGKLIILAACLYASLQVGLAAEKPRAENGMESTAENVSLPSGSEGNVTARSCSACPSLELKLTANSQFYNGAKPVSLKQLRQLFASQRQLRVLVAYYPQTSELTRIVITDRS